jgi:hypothetical protein
MHIQTYIRGCCMLGDWLAVASSALGQLLVWEWRSETYVLKQQGHLFGMSAVDFSPGQGAPANFKSEFVCINVACIMNACVYVCVCRRQLDRNGGRGRQGEDMERVVGLLLRHLLRTPGPR